MIARRTNRIVLSYCKSPHDCPGLDRGVSKKPYPFPFKDLTATIPWMEYCGMPCEVEFTDEFGDWWLSLTEDEQESVARIVRLLQDRGPALTRPFADTLHGATLKNLRELRIQHKGRPYRVLYVFDPSRRAILLIGGDKTGDADWYRRMIPLAEDIYAEYLREVSQADVTNRSADG